MGMIMAILITLVGCYVVRSKLIAMHPLRVGVAVFFIYVGARVLVWFFQTVVWPVLVALIGAIFTIVIFGAAALAGLLFVMWLRKQLAS